MNRLLMGPSELLQGRIEFNLIGEVNTDDDAIVVWAYLCQEDGDAKRFGYIDLD